MASSFKEKLKNLFVVINSNIIFLVAGILVTLILPNQLDKIEYGYWSLYLLYLSYACFFCLGIPDGIYLNIAGKNYEDLDKRKFKTYFNISIFVLMIFLLGWIIFSFITSKDSYFFFILLLIGISGLLACLINYISMIYQAVAKFKIYSRGYIIEKLTILFAMIFYLLFDYKKSIIIMGFSILGKLITVIYYYIKAKDILKAKHAPYKECLFEIFIFIKSGIWLTFSAIGTSVIHGISSFFIKDKLGIELLGTYSFIFSISGLFNIFFSAISIVIFPMLKKEKNINEIMNDATKIFDLLSIFILLSVGPIIFALQWLYPNYKLGFDCILPALILTILQGKASIIFNTAYKIENRLKDYVIIIGIIILITVVSIYLCTIIDISLFNISITSCICFIIWDIILGIWYKIKCNKKFDIGIFCYFIYLIIIIIKMLIKTNYFLIPVYLILIITIFVLIIKNYNLIKKYINKINNK